MKTIENVAKVMGHTIPLITDSAPSPNKRPVLGEKYLISTQVQIRTGRK